MKMHIDWGYVTKRWVIATVIIASLFLLLLVIIRFINPASKGTPVEGGENQPEIIEGSPKRPTQDDSKNTPQSKCGRCRRVSPVRKSKLNTCNLIF